MPMISPKRIAALCALPIAMLAAAPACAEILFFAENGCRGRVAFRYAGDRAIKESCKSDRAICRGKNDEARSMKVTGTTRPSEIRLYDDPGGGKNDDYSVIQFRRFKPEYRDYCVSTFERSGLLSTQGQILHKPRNGLDGKVSYIVLYP